MKSSIRIKLLSALCGLVVLFVALSWILNSFFLEKYYYYHKEESLISIYKTINKVYKGNPEALSLELEKMENIKGVNIIIFDKNLKVVYNSMQRDPNQRFREFMRMPQGPNPAESVIKNIVKEISKGKPVIQKGNDNRLNSSFINLYSILNKDNYIFLRTPVAAIKESVNIANTFFLFTGLIILFIGGILIFSITSKFTKPILELNEIAKRMAVLDFSRRYKVNSRDEIGNLGESINSMSEQLEKSIKELTDANRMLKEDIEKERKIDEMRKEFITNVSHELKTPIALIQGYAEGLKVNVNEDEENKNYYCDVISDEAVKMNRLVMNLLELSQLDSGVMEFDMTNFNITDLIQNVLKKNFPFFKERGITTTFNGENSFLVNADYYRIEQVFINYLNNAVNHLDGQMSIKVTIEDNSEYIRVKVFNTGKHIPEDSLERIWDSFFKVEKARTRKYGGSGMGLSIVRAIQDTSGKGYGVSNVDGGVEFWFEMDKAK